MHHYSKKIPFIFDIIDAVLQHTITHHTASQNSKPKMGELPSTELN